MDRHAADPHAGFLPDLAAHRILNGLAGLEEAGQGAVPLGRPAGGAAEQHALGVGGDDGGDHGRVGAGEADVGDAVAGWAVRALDGRGAAGEVVGWAHALVAGLDGEVEVAAAGAVEVAGVPVDEGAGLGDGGGCDCGVLDVSFIYECMCDMI